ncbi:UNVERIFIED_CONTAM: hypothetical protein K2H54_006541 [Gekko kuhli]
MLEDTLHPGSLDNRGKFHDWAMAAAMVEGRKMHAECKPELTLDPAQSAALIAANRPSLLLMRAAERCQAPREGSKQADWQKGEDGQEKDAKTDELLHSILKEGPGSRGLLLGGLNLPRDAAVELQATG